jgi:2-polyprenyl-3-methyl-5-hydroxy-6-metoxy-1,4-benzoquinol methylase
MFDWRALSDDPISPEVRAALAKHLIALDRGTYHSRERLLETFVHGRSVLDVGVAEHALVHAGSEHWLHGKIARWASRCVGIDTQVQLVQILKSRGFDVRCVDATSEADLGERVERVVLGEIIEHVDDPVRLLRFAKRHLMPGGRIIATTPNPFYVAWLYEALRCGRFIPNAEHVRWVSPAMAVEIGHRAGTPLTGYYRLVPTIRSQRPKMALLLALAKTTRRGSELVTSAYAFEFTAE